MKTFIKKNWKEILIFLWIVFAGMVVTACQTNQVSIEQKESIKNALSYLIKTDGTIYRNDVPQYGNPVNGVRYFETRNPLNKEQWGEVINYLFKQGFKIEQIQILTDYRIDGTVCPTRCPGD